LIIMIKKAASVILTIIFVAGALSEVLIWFGITPAHISNNKFISGLVNFSNFKIKIPVYLVSLIVLIVVFLYKYKIANREQKKPLSGRGKAEEIKQGKAEEIKEDKIAPSLSKEQEYLLLTLLQESSKKRNRYMVEEDYKSIFRKTTADFNIIEAQLKDLDLIDVFPSSMRGYYWQLTERGLRVASIIHSQIKS